ncbi:MAG: DMT family transporter [Hyphomonas sp.]|nr:DMT family transporter [Hyphomonas sp.]
MASPQTSASPATAYLFLILTMALWAGNHILGRWAHGNIPPMTLAFLRWSLAALLMFPFAYRSIRDDWPVIRREWPRLLLLGFMGSGIYNTLQYIALTGTTATNAAILNSWGPILIVLAGAALFRDKLRANQVTGMALSLIGVGVVVLQGEFERIATLSFNRGDLVMLFATGVWALYTALLRTRPKISTVSFAGVTYIIAGFVNLPLAGWEYAHGDIMEITPQTVAAVLYAGVLASLVAYYCYASSVELIGANRTGVFIHLIPLFTSIMAMVLLGEQPALHHAAGFALILAGVFIAQR